MDTDPNFNSMTLPYPTFPTEQGMAMKRSSFDCHSIGQSLKRFKISTSPGELRINRDIELLLAGKQWTSKSMVNHGHCSSDGGGGGLTNDRRGGHIHAEIYSCNARLVRDPVDPLLLRLTFLIHSRNNSQLLSSSSSPHTPPNERWTFCIRMPRMYPHEPPAITRVTRDIVPNHENMACLGNVNLDYYHHNNSATMAILASSTMQHHMEPPVPEQVLIQLLPPTSHRHHHSVPAIGSGNAHGITKNWDIDLATSICNSWTPISTLQDLIDFLMEIPSRRWDWWSKERNRRHHLQQQQYFST